MKQYSFLTSKSYTKRSSINEIGVFAKRMIKKNEIIAVWGGKICNKKEMSIIYRKNDNALKHPIAVFDDLYLVPPNNKIEPADRFNHSCNPNAGVKGQIVLIARKRIQPEAEITFDYETTQVGKLDGLPFKCKCNEKKCRKLITGTAWKSKEFFKKNKKFLSWYILKKVLPSA